MWVKYWLYMLTHWRRFDSPFYKFWWYFCGGRRKYRKAHGCDWNKETGIYPWWERPFRKNAR